MKHVILRSIFAAFMLLVLVIISGTEQASAQLASNTCCSFQLHAVNGLPEGCVPIQVTTVWDGVARTDVISVKGPSGTQTINFPNCPPNVPANLESISINGGPAITTVDIGGYSSQFMLCGVCAKVRVTRNPDTGCIAIGIMLCSQS